MACESLERLATTSPMEQVETQGEGQVSWWIDHHDATPWGALLQNVRLHAVAAKANVSDLFMTNAGMIKVYYPGATISRHQDGPPHRGRLNIVMNFSNTADFWWEDERGTNHVQEVKAGDLTIVRDGISHWAGPPKQVGTRIVGLLFS